MARTISTRSKSAATKRKTSSKTKQRQRLAVGYIRVSRKGQRGGENYVTEDQQRERIEALANAYGLKIVRWEIDIDQSGKKWNRPGFQRALRACEDREAEVVVVARLSRFARNVLAANKAIEQLDACGAVLIAGDVQIDTTTAAGKLMRTIFAALAEFELEVISDNWIDVKSRAIARGVKMGAEAPTGYLFGEGKRLVRDPELADHVVELFQRRAARETWAKLRTWWTEVTGMTAANGTLDKMIKNRAYLGESWYGDLRNTEAHEALVTLEEWDAAQPEPTIRAPRGDGALLTGIIQCGSCGGSMTTSSANTKRANGAKVKVPTYRCWRQGECSAPVAVKRELADEYAEREFLAWVAARRYWHSDGPQETELFEARQLLDDARGELSAFLRVAQAADDEKLFAEGVSLRSDAVTAAQIRVGELAAVLGADRIRLDVPDEWPNMTVEQKRQILSAVIVSFPVQRTHGSGSRVAFADRATIAWLTV